jgi:hypothetical protein
MVMDMAVVDITTAMDIMEVMDATVVMVVTVDGAMADGAMVLDAIL